MQQGPDYKQLYEQQSLLVEAMQQKLASVTHQVAELQRLVFGSKTEKFIPSVLETSTQLELDMPVEQPAKPAPPKYSRSPTADSSKRQTPTASIRYV
ncbi:MAG: hypothetical protein INR73_19030 [Williamsia sp.]|nr:hypothetical protein [Williamsia sp.]